MALDKRQILRNAAGMIASLKKKSGRTYHCCGLPVEVDHKKAGCDGNVHPSMGDSSHSGEIFMSEKDLRNYTAKHGKPKSIRKTSGGYYVRQK